MLPSQWNGEKKTIIWWEGVRGGTWIFSPLVFSTCEGWEILPLWCIYKRIVAILAEKTTSPIVGLCIALLRSSIMCLRGSRSALHRPAHSTALADNMDLAGDWGVGPSPHLIVAHYPFTFFFFSHFSLQSLYFQLHFCNASPTCNYTRNGAHEVTLIVNAANAG